MENDTSRENAAFEPLAKAPDEQDPAMKSTDPAPQSAAGGEAEPTPPEQTGADQTGSAPAEAQQPLTPEAMMPAPAAEEDDAPDRTQPHVTVLYHLTGEDVTAALSYFQKKVLLKRNVIYTVLLAIVFGIYTYELISGSNRSAFAVVCLLLCVLVSGTIWLTPLRHRKKMAAVVGGETQQYSIEFYPDFAFIPTAAGGVKLSYDNKELFAAETAALFIIGVSKAQVFAVPKRDMKKSEAAEISGWMKAGFQDRFEAVAEKAKK